MLRFHAPLHADRTPEPGEHAAVRCRFRLRTPAAGGPIAVRLRLCVGDVFSSWLDGEHLADGPHRVGAGFTDAGVEVSVEAGAGEHVLAIHQSTEGVATRLGGVQRPELWIELESDGLEEDPGLGVRVLPLVGYGHGLRRLNPQLGWAEWANLSAVPAGWREPDFDDAGWGVLASDPGGCRSVSAAELRAIPRRPIEPRLMAEGSYAERFGYERDDPPARFFLRDLDAPCEGAAGRWYRYDLGRVHLFYPRLRVADAAGTEVELAYSEELHAGGASGRVLPWIPYSAGRSCSLDHYTLATNGGRGTSVGPVAPRGGRFVEVHVAGAGTGATPPELIVEERGFFGPAVGRFESDDPVLDRVWAAGVDTLRACARTPSPTTRRASAAPGSATSRCRHRVAGVAFDDLSLVRRGLREPAAGRSDHGLVAGLCPGPQMHIPSFALHWVRACWAYFRQTGDRAILRELEPALTSTLAAFTPVGGESLQAAEGWHFLDWASPLEEEPNRFAVNALLLQALRVGEAWLTALDRAGRGRGARGAGGGARGRAAGPARRDAPAGWLVGGGRPRHWAGTGDRAGLSR